MTKQEALRTLRAAAGVVWVSITGYSCSSKPPDAGAFARASVPLDVGQRSSILRVTAEGGELSLYFDGCVRVVLDGETPGATPATKRDPYCLGPSSFCPEGIVPNVECGNLDASGVPVDYELVRQNADEAVEVSIRATVANSWQGPHRLGVRLEVLGPP